MSDPSAIRSCDTVGLPVLPALFVRVISPGYRLLLVFYVSSSLFWVNVENAYFCVVLPRFVDPAGVSCDILGLPMTPEVFAWCDFP